MSLRRLLPVLLAAVVAVPALAAPAAAHAAVKSSKKSGGGSTGGGSTGGGSTGGSTGGGLVPPNPLVLPTGTVFSEDFQSLPLGTGWVDGSSHGQWTSVYNGYGQTGVETDGSQVLTESPKAATSPSETHAALVTSNSSFGDLDATVYVRTVQQLRTPTPNPWEVGWVLWHYTDDTHFYYLALKPNGWELGKEDPAYPGAQRFLATGSSPTYAVGSWHTVRVRQLANVVTVWGDGVQLASFTDTQTPYLTGSLGLYCEDSHVHFDDLTLGLS